MTTEEAKKIFDYWRNYVEISDKLLKVFRGLPESFLPYPKELSEEALDIVSKICLSNGDRKSYLSIQTIKSSISYYMEDEKGLNCMHENLELILKNNKLKEDILYDLKKSRDFWLDNINLKK